MNVSSSLHGFPDMTREQPYRLHPSLCQGVDFCLQLWNQVHLRWIQGYRCQAEPKILLKNERKISQQQRTLERRRRYGISDQTAQRFGLGSDHWNNLSRRGASEMSRGKTKNSGVKIKTEAS